MGMELPKTLTDWLDKDWRRPPQNFVDCSLYYTGLNVAFIDYMRTVVRPCMAYASGCADGLYNSGAKLNVGQTIKDTAVKLIKGDKVLFDGDDNITKLIADIWAPGVNFETFLESAIDYLLMGGTCAVKLNKDRAGRYYPTAVRVDRFYADMDDLGNVLCITIFNSFLFSETYGARTSNQCWLVEERYFNDAGMPCVMYKVHIKSGVLGKEILPVLGDGGLDMESLPVEVQRHVKAQGIVLNREMLLPFKDGLGVWLWRRTANNSSVPGLPMGDPLLYGALDIIFAADVAFSGSITDVVLGKGKVLVPKRFLSTVREEFSKMGFKVSAAGWDTASMSDDDDSLVYVYCERDKDFTPQPVQFNIRSEQYRGMLEIYLRQAVTKCGFAPTSIFPFLQDESSKTATEVTAEENLTRATIQSIHQIIVPAINKMLREVLYLYGFIGRCTVKLSDYIGNKILRDQNIRENYLAGLMPRETAVQRINDISAGETEEYLQKIDADEDRKRRAETPEFTMDEAWRYMNGISEPTAEYAGYSAGGSGNENKAGSEE